MKPIRNKPKYALVSSSGDIKVATLREYRADCIQYAESCFAASWSIMKKYGWKCKKVYISITEEKI